MEHTLSGGIASKASKTAGSVTQSPAEQSRILSKPIDILCFGRAGVGKTALLEALTHRDLGSTPRLGHGTQTLTSVDIQQQVPVGEDTHDVPIRFWDTKGVESWREENLSLMFNELEQKQINPICVLYCASAQGRVDPEVLQSILKHFHDDGIVVFYVITNMYAGTDEQVEAQIDEGSVILKEISTQDRVPRTIPGRFSSTTTVEDVYSFGSKTFLLAVNSKEYASKRSGTSLPPKNIDQLMSLCVENLDEEQLAQYFLATIQNRDFWARATDKCRDVLRYLEKHAHVNVRRFVDLWQWLKSFITL